MPRYFEFDVTLTRAKPRVWRRFLLPTSASFMDLHHAIQDACGWRHCHLFEFFEDRPFGTSIAGLPDAEYDRADVPDAHTMPLASHFGMQKSRAKKCVYVYDFGDSWEHTVTLKRTVDLDEQFPRRLLNGKGAFPYEDCGGMSGYVRCAEFARTGRDPWGQDGEELAEWLEGWHPDTFDLEATRARFDTGLLVNYEYDDDLDDMDDEDAEDDEAYWGATYKDQVDMLLEAHPGLQTILNGIQAQVDASPEESLKSELVATALARGTSEPWTSVVPCEPPLGAEDCIGSFDVWLQQVPRGVGWRCGECGAQGVITGLLDGRVPVPDMSVRSVKNLLKMTIGMPAWDDICNQDAFVDADLPILVAAGDVPRGVELVGNRAQFVELRAVLQEQLSRMRGKRRQRLQGVVDNIEQLLDKK